MGLCACRKRQAVVDLLTRAWHRDQGAGSLIQFNCGREVDQPV